MTQFRQIVFFLFLMPVLVHSVRAQSTTSTITDTVKNADGSPFNGTAVITWTGNSASMSGTPIPYSTSVKIYNGVLLVALVPTVASSTYYLATFNSSDGKTSWVENWQVGPSTSPLTLVQVRTTLPTTPSDPGGATLAMNQVVGLNSYLNALSGSFSTVSSTIGSINSTVVGLNTSVSTLVDRVNTIQANAGNSNSSIAVEGELPSGTINSTNSIFNIATTPFEASSVMVFRNGILQRLNNDYSFSGKTINFAVGSLPQTGDGLQVSYRVAAPPPSIAFVDNETPQGLVNGTNLTFVLAATPTAGTLRLYRNGALLRQGTDFMLNGATANFVSIPAAPVSGDSLTAFYRVTNPTP